MVGGRPSSSSTAGTVGLWKHQSIYKGKRPAQEQLPLLHQLLGYIGKRDFPTDGNFWKLPFGKRAQLYQDDEGDDEVVGRDKRDYDQVPLLHYTFGKRAYGPLLHSMPGKRSWNDFPIVLPKFRKYDKDMPVLHRFGFGKRTYTPLLHSMAGKRGDTADYIDMSKRQKELLEHTIDENEDYYLGKRSNLDDSQPYYDENIDDTETRVDNDDDLKRWRNFIRRYPNPIVRKKRSVAEEDDQKEEEKKSWGSGKINLDDLKSGSWFGKREAKDDKRASPLLHQLGGIVGKRSPLQASWNMFSNIRNKKSTPLLHQLGPWGKRFGEDIVWGKMYQSIKRSTPMLHQIGGLGKRFGDDIRWDTLMNGMKKNLEMI